MMSWKHAQRFISLSKRLHTQHAAVQQGSRPVRVLQCVWEWVEVWQGVQGRPNCLSARWRRGVPQAPACGRLIKIQTVNQRVNGTKGPSGGSTDTAAVQLTQNQMVLRLTATHTHTHTHVHVPSLSPTAEVLTVQGFSSFLVSDCIHRQLPVRPRKRVARKQLHYNIGQWGFLLWPHISFLQKNPSPK